MTSANCSSGCQRIASVGDALMAMSWLGEPVDLRRTAVINVQGDQSFLDPDVIEAMAAQFEPRNFLPEVVTPVCALGAEMFSNPNVVKALLAHDGRSLYFSRTAIPHVRDLDSADWHRHTTCWGHVGIYGFRGDLLKAWRQLPPSSLKDLERLEQLRLIEAANHRDVPRRGNTYASGHCRAIG